MTSLVTAKLLFFIALTVGPQGSNTFFATSNSENYYWSNSEDGWALQTKGLPSCDWKDRGSSQVGGTYDSRDERAIADRHNWQDGLLYDLPSGNQIKKQGNAVFYIIDPGAPNQKVFTILYPRK
jgi:hypothetical protein